MDNDIEYIKELMAQYKADIEPLMKYLPWLREATAASAMTMYRGESMGEGSLAFPVYDSTLMSFIKVANDSALIDRNYPYVYTRKRITTPAQERDIIVACDYKSWDVLKGIFSRYVLGGRTKGVLWSQGVSEQIFCLVLEKMQEIVTEWDAERNLSDK
ncbi:MAG: hypothetical protein MJ130_01155 [Lachnospiraceae bacterium]|nr:hypothetical protein [Lachnospiraceae bacterium]